MTGARYPDGVDGSVAALDAGTLAPSLKESGKCLHLLWITPRWPLPATDGARQATVSLLKNLTALGARIDLATFVAADDPVDVDRAKAELGVASVTTFLRGLNTTGARLRRLVAKPSTAITLAPFVQRNATSHMRTFLMENSRALVLFDGLHAAGCLPTDDSVPERSRLVLRPHNVERELWVQAAKMAKNPLIAAGLRMQGALIGRFERWVARRSGYVFPVSDPDHAMFVKLAGDAKVETVPIGLDLRPFEPRVPDVGSESVLFVGRLDWEPNRAGLAWFLREVWPTVVTRRPSMRLNVVGSGAGDWLDSFRSLPNLNVVGRVPTVMPWYRDAMATIVPVFVGSGTRVKVIEASLLGKASIGTALGVEGVGLVADTSFIRAENAGDWIAALDALTWEKALSVGTAAHEAVEARFHARSVAERMLSVLVAERGVAGGRGDKDQWR